MKQLFLTLMGILMLAMAGCNGSKLADCQAELEKVKDELIQKDKSSTELIENLMNDFAKKRDAVDSLTTENNKLKDSQKELMTTARKTLLSKIDLQKKLKKSQADLEKSNNDLKTAKMEMEKAIKALADMAKKVEALEKAAAAPKSCCTKPAAGAESHNHDATETSSGDHTPPKVGN